MKATLTIGGFFEDLTMFEVREETAQAVFNAQKEKAQGRLRLDISSRTFPSDVEQPLDLEAARQAIGERFVEMIEQCAAEAVSLGPNRDGFEPNVVPPPCRNGESLTIMPGKNQFEPFVEQRLVHVLASTGKARATSGQLELLAEDFYRWCRGDDADAADFAAEKERVAVACHTGPIGLTPLSQKATLWRAPPPSNSRRSQLRHQSFACHAMFQGQRQACMNAATIAPFNSTPNSPRNADQIARRFKLPANPRMPRKKAAMIVNIERTANAFVPP